MLHGLGDGEFHKHLAAERQHHDEERKPAMGIVHRDGSVGTPVDLRALAGSEVQLEIDRPLGRPDAADVIPQDRDAAAVALLAQTLEDLLSTIRVGVQQSRDVRLEGIKDTAARPAAPRLEARTRRPRGDRPRVKAQRPGGLHDRQALAIMAVVDLAERLVIDHDRLRCQARALPPAPRMQRECPDPVVANGPWCGRCHLVTASRRYGRLSQSEQQVVPLRPLVMETAPNWPFR